jgi:hypothetical protein
MSAYIEGFFSGYFVFVHRKNIISQLEKERNIVFRQRFGGFSDFPCGDRVKPFSSSESDSKSRL